MDADARSRETDDDRTSGQPGADAHHAVHWADGGATSLANLLLLCRPHHRLLHRCGDGRFSVTIVDVRCSEDPTDPSSKTVFPP